VPGTRPRGSSLVASWQAFVQVFRGLRQCRLLWLAPFLAVPLLLALALKLLAAAIPRRRQNQGEQLDPFVYPLY